MIFLSKQICRLPKGTRIEQRNMRCVPSRLLFQLLYYTVSKINRFCKASRVVSSNHDGTDCRYWSIDQQRRAPFVQRHREGEHKGRPPEEAAQVGGRDVHWREATQEVGPPTPRTSGRFARQTRSGCSSNSEVRAHIILCTQTNPHRDREPSD